MNELIEKFTEYIDHLAKSDKQKKYGYDLLSQLIKEFNVMEKRMEQATGFHPNEYDKLLQKTIGIMYAFGFTTVDFSQDLFSDSFIKFIDKNKPNFTKDMTFRMLENTRKLYADYKLFYEKEPETLEQLKEFKNHVKNA